MALGRSEGFSHRFHLNVTGVCNLKCRHCYQADHTTKPVPVEQIREILGLLQGFRAAHGERGRAVLTLGGGEPTTRRDLEEVIRLGRDAGFALRLVTNATLIDPKRAKALRKAGLRMVQVSLDGVTEQEHDLIRGKGAWKNTMAGISALRGAGMVVVLSMVLLPEHNLENCHLLLDLSKLIGVWGVKYQRLVKRGQASHGLESHGCYDDAFVRILRHAAAMRYRRLLLLFDPLAQSLALRFPELCRRIWFLQSDLCSCSKTEAIEIDGNGDISYCRVGKRLGNLWQGDLLRIWQENDLLTQIRARSPQGPCKACAAWSGCQGGCPAINFGNSGEITAPDPGCPSWEPSEKAAGS